MLVKTLSKFGLLKKSGLFRKIQVFDFSKILIKNGVIVNADGKTEGNVLINNRKIERIMKWTSDCEQFEVDKIIDAKGKYIIPGGIDPHVHMELPFMGTVTVDDFNIGSQAAVAGGTTCFIDFIIPGENGLLAAYEDWRKRADPKVNCDYTMHCAITHWNSDVHKEMEKIVKLGISSFKLFMAYKGTPLYKTDTDIIEIFQRAKELGASVLVHAENGELITFNQKRLNDKGVFGPEGHLWSRGDEVEAEAVHRVITMAKEVNMPLYLVHIMKPSAAEEIRRAKKKGYVVFAEALASGLGVDGLKCHDHDFDKASAYIMSPALSDNPLTKELLFKLLATHDLDTTATDNCVFTSAQKRMGEQNFTKIPNGINGIEDRMSIVWDKGVNSGILTPADFVRVTSTNTAKIFNLYPKKGVIKEGSDADLVVWDPCASKVISAKAHHHAGDFNIFEGIKVTGLPETTISAGRVMFHDGQLFPMPGKGQFIKRENYGYTYERIGVLDKMRDKYESPVNRKNSPSPNIAQKYERLQSDFEIQREKLEKYSILLKSLKQQLPEDYNNKQQKIWDSKYPLEISSLESVLSSYLPNKELEAVNKILYGQKNHQLLDLPQKAKNLAKQNNFDLAGYKIHCAKEQNRESRIIRVAAIQNSIKSATTEKVKDQQQKMLNWIQPVIETAHLSGVNILGLQECWSSPFFMCTREKYPWLEFAEDYQNGLNAQLFKELSKKYNMVIVNHILERDQVKGTIHNSTVVFDNKGKILGRHHKNHIPRVGDFNESTYYMEGNTGHPVFETEFGKISSNICYGRHFPLNWLMFALNGAEIVFNPSATVGALSEPMWGIEARCAAIANHYYTVSINRVGSESYPNDFTSGDGKTPHKQFGMFYGSSHLNSPDASRTPALSRTRDGLLVTEIDLNLCRQQQDKWMFSATRRLEMYAKELQQVTSSDFKPQIIK